MQDALTGSNPTQRHLCKVPCRGASRRLFGFFNPSNALSSVVRVIDSYDVQDVFPKVETARAPWNKRPCKRWGAN